MKFPLLAAFVGATALLTTACSPDAKTTEVVETTPEGAVVTTTTTVDTAQYWNALPALSDRVAADLALTDTVVVRKVKNAYRSRAQRLSAAERQYAADTTGRYAALRAANDEADRELQAALDAARYRTYQQNRAAYYQGTPYTVVMVAEGATERKPAVTKYEKEADGDVKIKYADGSKVKIEADGDRKVKYANDTKIKTDEDGTKVKK